MPSLIKYTIDMAWVLAFAFLFIKVRFHLKKNLVPFFAFIIVWLVYVLIVYLFNFQSPFYFLWGIRNNFRFYIAFLAFISFFDDFDIKLCFNLIEILFWVNVVVIIFQFFALDLKGDYLGGIFGTTRGSNAWNLILFCIVSSKSILNFISGNEKLLTFALKNGFALLLSALCEIKFFFILFIIILILSSVFSKFSYRKLLLIFFGSFLFFVASSILTAVFEGSVISFESITKLIFASSYSSQEDLGRFTAIPTISENILTDIPSKLFGMGIGNCDTSAFEICNTPFFKTYGYLNYSWLSSAFIFLETGYIGLGLNLLFYVVCFVLSYKKSKSNETNRLYCQMAMIFSVICIALTFYNSSLRTEAGYMAYFVLALPYISAGKGETQFDDIETAAADNI